MSDPTVSVVIPTRNRAGKCAAAVKSVLGQSLPPLEILVCDDCSEDETAGVIQEIARDEPSVVLLPGARPSGGPGGPRNRGIAHARGSFVAFLDDDDEWFPEKLASQTPLLRETNAIVCANAVRSSGGLYFEDRENCSFSQSDLLLENPVIISSAIVSRERLMRAGGFPTSGHIAGCADYAMWLRVVGQRDAIVRVGEPLVTYQDSDMQRLSNEALAMATAEVLAFVHALRNDDNRTRLLRPLANRIALALGAAVNRGGRMLRHE